jgi:hypothetical protein
MVRCNGFKMSWAVLEKEHGSFSSWRCVININSLATLVGRRKKRRAVSIGLKKRRRE